MNLSPEAWLKALAPWMLAGTAVTLALVFAVLFALFAVPYFLLRFRRHRENASGAAETSGAPAARGLGGFTWTSAQDEDRRSG
ncbi:hypothetical protein OHA37_05900 [Streptomyces sp. NBC_00335]|uniref:hypothetical protein n=1 Tax=unclassified Streptomyces TaxID=2593676 RepID=UPI002255C945|nr:MULTISPECIES: hypothetical protein [unclassified Streptomyces]MCX5403414.1 hypothetical protein [Streptomyces sp. NBC_00086]